MQVLHEEFPSSKVTELGVYLRLPTAMLEEFSDDNKKKIKERYALPRCDQLWLENDKDKSCMKLVGAVQTCGHAVLADTIRYKYGALHSMPSAI